MDIPKHPAVDETNGLIVLGKVGNEVICLVPMIYNDRITIATLDEHPDMYSHGWCYDKGAPALLAVLAWDPLTEDEPPGYKKRATPGHRRAPNASASHA